MKPTHQPDYDPAAEEPQDALVARILAFLAEIGVPHRAAELSDDEFLPGLRVEDGVLLWDLGRLRHPGDLLHEAGHIAVCDPDERSALRAVAADGGDEMAAIAWSYAAACRLGVASSVLFHEGGYGGPANGFAAQFDAGRYVGVPLLQ